MIPNMILTRRFRDTTEMLVMPCAEVISSEIHGADRKNSQNCVSISGR